MKPMIAGSLMIGSLIGVLMAIFVFVIIRPQSLQQATEVRYERIVVPAMPEGLVKFRPDYKVYVVEAHVTGSYESYRGAWITVMRPDSDKDWGGQDRIRVYTFPHDIPPSTPVVGERWLVWYDAKEVRQYRWKLERRVSP